MFTHAMNFYNDISHWPTSNPFYPCIYDENILKGFFSFKERLVIHGKEGWLGKVGETSI